LDYDIFVDPIDVVLYNQKVSVEFFLINVVEKVVNIRKKISDRSISTLTS